MTNTWPEGAVRLHYFDPTRPRLRGTPQLLFPDGRPTNTILPSLIITPEPDGRFRLWGFFHMEGSTSAPREVTLTSWGELAAAHAEWLACPEYFAVTRMNWWPRDKPLAPARTFKTPTQALKELDPNDLDFS